MKKIWKQRYQIIEEVGKGGNGKVYKVWDLHLEKQWAMKVLEENSISFSLVPKKGEKINELQVLKKISHVNFPRIVDAFEEDERKILIMDYVRGVTLEEIIRKGPMKEKEILKIAKQVCEALLYLHQNSPTLLFLDLKPSNIIVGEDGIVKLVDMGSVVAKGENGLISGSFGFASPEQIRIQKGGAGLNEQSDIFSFGMILYAMAVGTCSRMPMVEAGSRFGIFVRKSNPNLSVYLEKILEKCTRGNRDRRYPGMREVKKELENWEQALKKKKWRMGGIVSYGRRERKRWYQEKSIFCTEGKHSFYIAKKIMLLVICILCLCPGLVIEAGKTGEDLEGKEKDLKVIIRDEKYRKVLVKKDCAYETDSDILLEIPWKSIEGEKCRIVVECEDESREKKRFSIDCIYEK